jgi:hypothetical protein
MSFRERRTLVNILAGAGVLAAYCIYAFGKNNSGAVADGDLVFWARTMLIFIGIGIGVAIATQIIFHIVQSIGIAIQKTIQEKDCDDKKIEKFIETEMTEDEMDKQVESKSMWVSYVVIGIAFVTGLFTLVFGLPVMVMLNILFIGFMGGSLLEGFAKLYFYRKGV